MNLKISLLFLAGISLFSAPSFSQEKEVSKLDYQPQQELVVIQAVSSTGRTFVIGKGTQDGIQAGQMSLFQSTHFSLRAVAATTSRLNSQWKMLTPQATLPFSRGEIITFTNALAAPLSGQNQAISPHSPIGKSREMGENKLVIMAGLKQTLKQSTEAPTSTSTVATSDEGTRSGYHLEVGYNFWANDFFTLGPRLRFDSEVEKGDFVNQSTTRRLAILDICYHFHSFAVEDSYYYFSLYAGVGDVQTNIEEESKSGNTLLLPGLRLGKLFPIGKGDWSLAGELGVEAINSSESFEGEIANDTALINVQVSLGIQF